jgi:cytochrome c oxidase assembly protein subunit 15
MPTRAADTERVFLWTTLVAGALTLVVVVLGAYVRLSDAGLGCPDWPGCYGHVAPPAHIEGVEAAKAWKEMVHRYAASTLGLLILVLASIAWWRRQEVGQPVRLPLLLVPLVLLQGALGMWTVTLLLKPLVVTLHLFGGMTILSLLCLMALRQTGWLAPKLAAPRRLRGLGHLALVLLAMQLVLGAWVSSNYAAVACPDLPTCQGAWWPEADFGEGFVLWRGLGIDYEGGVLDHPARVAIHLVHRLGAVVVAAVLGLLAIWTWREGRRAAVREWRVTGALLLGALAFQLGVAVLMVEFAFPLPLATAHNLGAALLLLALTVNNSSLHGHDRVRS